MAGADRFPWPRAAREDGRPITNPRFEGAYDASVIFESSIYKNRPITDEWDNYDTAMYNEWLRVTIRPTLTLDADFLRKARILDEVLQILSKTGVGSLGIEPQELYLDLVRQFMATLRVVEGEGGSPRTTYVHFKLHGRAYRLTLDELADIYGMDTTSSTRIIPPFADATPFYEHIADGPYQQTVRHVAIRHPALRYVTKLLANTLFCSTETNVLRTRELFFLYLGLEDVYPGLHRAAAVRPHLGSVFVQHLLSLQGAPFGSRKTVRFGSLLTPIFRHLREDAVATIRQPAHTLLGAHYLNQGHHITQSGEYCF